MPDDRERGGADRFRLGKYWIDTESEGGSHYRYWYVPGTRKVRRRTLGTTDFEEAKLKLAEIVVEMPDGDAQTPEAVLLVTVLNHYMTHHGEQTRSASMARRAVALMLDYMKEVIPDRPARAADLTLARQHGFMRWCRKTGLSAKSIANYLTTIHAAMSFASQPQIVETPDGETSEVQILTSAPKIHAGEAKVVQVTGSAPSRPRDWIPTDKQLATYIDSLVLDHHFRYVVMALNTWARPEAILEMNVFEQVNFESGLVHLNPRGRQQNKKVRPLIPLTDNLRGWLLYWNVAYPITHKGKAVRFVDKTLRKIARNVGFPELTPYTLRHYMATRIRHTKRVSREQRQEWLGHRRRDHTTTAWYESFDPDFLSEAREETDAIMARLDQLCDRSLFAPKTLPNQRILLVK